MRAKPQRLRDSQRSSGLAHGNFFTGGMEIQARLERSSAKASRWNSPDEISRTVTIWQRTRRNRAQATDFCPRCNFRPDFFPPSPSQQPQGNPEGPRGGLAPLWGRRPTVWLVVCISDLLPCCAVLLSALITIQRCPNMTIANCCAAP